MSEINELREELANLRERVAVLEAEKRLTRHYSSTPAGAKLNQLLRAGQQQANINAMPPMWVKGDIPPGTTRS